MGSHRLAYDAGGTCGGVHAVKTPSGVVPFCRQGARVPATCAHVRVGHRSFARDCHRGWGGGVAVRRVRHEGEPVRLGALSRNVSALTGPCARRRGSCCLGWSGGRRSRSRSLSCTTRRVVLTLLTVNEGLVFFLCPRKQSSSALGKAIKSASYHASVGSAPTSHPRRRNS